MALTFIPYRSYGLRSSFRTKYRISEGYAEILKLRPSGWLVVQRLPLEEISTKIEGTKLQKLFGRGSIKITTVSGETMLWEKLKKTEDVQDALYNWKTLEDANSHHSTSGENISDSGIQPTIATPALDSELEKLRKEFKFYSPAQKAIKTASLPKVDEEWELEQTLPSGLNFLLNVEDSYKNEIKELLQGKLLGKDIYTDFDERPYLNDVDRFEREDDRRKIQLWNTKSVAWHPTGMLLATAGVGNIPRIWNVETWESTTKRVYWDTAAIGENLCWSSDGELFLSGDHIFDGNTSRHLCHATGMNYKYSDDKYMVLRGYHVYPMVSSTNNFSPWRPVSRQLVFGESEKNLVLRNGRTGEIEKIIDCGVSSNITDFAWHPKGRFIAIAFDEHNIRIVDIDEAKIVDDLSVQNLVGWSSDGKTLIARKDKNIDDFVVWDALETEEKPMPEEMNNELWFKRFSKNISADGLRYIKAGHGESHIYSLESDELVFTLPKEVTSAAWCPIDGGLLATCGGSETHIWKI